jgi:phosphatidylglycerophosphate synthase
MNWWRSLLAHARAHPGGAEYTPGQMIFVGIVGITLFSFFLAKSLRSNAIMRFRASDDEISRDKKPRRYWFNILGFVAFIFLSLLLVLDGIFLMLTD